MNFIWTGVKVGNLQAVTVAQARAGGVSVVAVMGKTFKVYFRGRVNRTCQWTGYKWGIKDKEELRTVPRYLFWAWATG